jgi:hypothetical protein
MSPDFLEFLAGMEEYIQAGVDFKNQPSTHNSSRKAAAGRKAEAALNRYVSKRVDEAVGQAFATALKNARVVGDGRR